MKKLVLWKCHQNDIPFKPVPIREKTQITKINSILKQVSDLIEIRIIREDHELSYANKLDNPVEMDKCLEGY